MLTCQDLAITREDKLILTGVGFTLFPTSSLLIQGKNGSGKTSLLKICASLHNPSSGNIFYNDVNIKDALDTYRSLIFYLGHTLGLDQELTVYENLKFWAALNNTYEAIQAAASVFNLSDYFDYPVYKLSLGWQKKLALSKALLSRARIWLLDEPYTNLDKESCVRLSNMLTTRCAQGGIVILTSHQDVPNLKCISINLEDFAA
jgi:heme exporter protein A